MGQGFGVGRQNKDPQQHGAALNFTDRVPSWLTKCVQVALWEIDEDWQPANAKSGELFESFVTGILLISC